MATLAYSRRGDGPPLILLHGIGSARQAWDPVIPAVAEQFDVIAADLPGFGESDSLPASIEPTPTALAERVAGFLDEMGIVKAHVVGNSLGGWVGLELAGMCPLASLTLLSPAGLWRGRTPLYNRLSLRASRWATRHAADVLDRLMTYRLARILVLGQTHGRPAALAPEYARMAIRAMATCPGFDATMRATESRRYRSGPRFDAPVTVAFGSRDHLLLRRQSRRLDELPAATAVVTLPRCGHVPMADDPAAVSAFITASALAAVADSRR